jgi:uncharacterized protein involved in exopolysaccharide biosynthesis
VTQESSSAPIAIGWIVGGVLGLALGLGIGLARKGGSGAAG